jgi:hypothetical protein
LFVEKERLMNAILTVLFSFWSEIAPKLATLAGLILLDVLLGISLAVRQKRFQWSAVGAFYYTMILPYLISWTGFVLVLQFINVNLVPPGYQEWLIGLGNLGWVVIVLTILGSIKRNGVGLYGEAFAPPADDPLEARLTGLEHYEG